MEEMLEQMINAMDKTYPILTKIDEPGLFLSVIFTMIDQYAADHDIEPERIMHLTQMSCEAQKGAFKTLGKMQKTT